MQKFQIFSYFAANSNPDMSNFRSIIVSSLIGLFILSCSAPKHITLTDEQLKANLKKHISTLASDAFEGRETGTKGEQLASDYISSQFKEIGLKPKGEKKYLQEFSFNEGATFGAGTQLYVNANSYKVNDDFYPLAYSANNIFIGYVTRVGYGITASKLDYDDYKGKINLTKKIFVIESGTPDKDNPHGKFGDYTDLRSRIDLAISKGATAIIFINSDTAAADPKADFNNKTTPSTIPVIFAKGEAAKILKSGVVTNCTVGVEIHHIEKKGHNVIGVLNNKAANTIVIGAHYDHLGFGGESSLYRGASAIHNGADDNASGDAALIEIARYISGSKNKNNNYLFIAFSGEEKGLLGSNYFVKHPTIDLKTVNYMLNMDMVGRLKPDEPTLIINGNGTSPSWKTVLDTMMSGVKIKTTESGVGPSDHTSFYLQNIPVLHFFSGTHSDYHKPSDDEDKINYDGETTIIRIMENIIDKLNSSGKLSFTKTKEDKNEDAPKFKVTLGVVPDYAFDGEGMRIDGVSDGKPAAKAGLQPGDVVIQLGENKILDMMSYMKALGKFTKGETTKVKVLRGKEVVEKDITF
jgi:hypothetical protein